MTSPGLPAGVRDRFSRGEASAARRSSQPECVVELFQSQPSFAEGDGAEHLRVERDLVQRDTVMDPQVQVFVPHRVVLPSAAHTLFEVTTDASFATWPIGTIPARPGQVIAFSEITIR